MLVLSIMRFMDILKIYTEDQLLIKYYEIKQNMIDINVDLLQLFINTLIKCFLVVLLKAKLFENKT